MSDRTENKPGRTSKDPHPQVRALCCQCGHVRETSTYGSDEECVVRRKCPTCGFRTWHACLRDDLAPQERNALDETTLSAQVSPAVSRMIDTLEDCGVRVWWDAPVEWQPTQAGFVRQWLDDNSWHVELNPAANVVDLMAALEAAWCLMALAGDDVGGDQWRSIVGEPGDPERPPCRYRMLSSPATPG